MEKINLLSFGKKSILLSLMSAALVLIITFGFGYFFGRYEQAQINKSLLQIVPDVNCGYESSKN